MNHMLKTEDQSLTLYLFVLSHILFQLLEDTLLESRGDKLLVRLSLHQGDEHSRTPVSNLFIVTGKIVLHDRHQSMTNLLK